MSWQDRIVEAAYIAPSGERFTFEYEDVSREVDKKTAAFEYADVDGTGIQDLGRSGRRYPIRVIFWGADYDLRVDAFLDALLERGTGTLVHPRYGSVTVVPFGTISQRDDLKSAANQAVVEVTFWESLTEVYPSSQESAADDVSAAVDDFTGTMAGDFAENAPLSTVADKATFKSRYEAALESTKLALQNIASEDDAVQSQFNAIFSSIDQSLDLLVGQPATLAAQTALLIQAPGRVVQSIAAQLDAYAGLFTDAIADTVDFYKSDIFASSYISGMAVASLNADFQTRGGAIEAAETILNTFTDYGAWTDAEFPGVDTGGTYDAVQTMVAAIVTYLITVSFSLKQERTLVTTRARTIIDLEAELYGTVGENLDLLIQSNALTGSEILEVPRGREIIYYA